MKVIGAGFGRTGTSSLKGALETLGFGPCYHMSEVFSNPSHSKVWLSSARGEEIDWKDLFKKYDSTCDWPACSFYRELIEEYPEAKVILTVRDPERWYESVLSTIYTISSPGPGSTFVRSVSLFVPHLRRIRKMVHELIWDGTFDGRFEDKEYAVSVFEAHNEEVRSVVPPENLLVYNVKQGWEPLCDFLGVEAPDEPFPHLNDASTFRRMIYAGYATTVALPTLAAVALLLTLRRLRRL